MTQPIMDSSRSAAALMPRGFTGVRGAFGGAAAVTATQTRDLELSITTDEGDVVTLSMHQERELTAASYRDVARRGHGRGHGHGAQQVTSSFERSVELTVQGDLNAQERADILALAKDLRQVAKAFFRDHLASAQKALAQFDDLGSLQSFSFEVSQQQSVSVLVQAGGAAKPPALPLPVLPQTGGGDETVAGTAVPACDTPVCGVAEQA